MKKFFYFFLAIPLVFACQETPEISSINPVNWDKRIATINPETSMTSGKTYLSVYSQIYSQTEHKTHNLTAMVSLRNTSISDTIYILNADYFNTKGKRIRSYFNKPIYLSPLETVEIIIDELDISGGTGANFIFEWKTPIASPEPIFEGIMSSTMGQQGLSFTTIGKRIH